MMDVKPEQNKTLEELVADRTLSNADITAMTGLDLETVRQCRCRVLAKAKPTSSKKKTRKTAEFLHEFRHIDPSIIRNTSLTIEEAAKKAKVPVATMRQCRITANIHTTRKHPKQWSKDELTLLELDVTDATLARYIDRTETAIKQKRATFGQYRCKTENPYHLQYLRNMINPCIPSIIAANELDLSVEFVKKRREKIAAQSCEE